MLKSMICLFTLPLLFAANASAETFSIAEKDKSVLVAPIKSYVQVKLNERLGALNAESIVLENFAVSWDAKDLDCSRSYSSTVDSEISLGTCTTTFSSDRAKGVITLTKRLNSENAVVYTTVLVDAEVDAE